MDHRLLDTSWIWHPEWNDSAHMRSSAGGFVHFRKTLQVDQVPSHPIIAQISADTRYKLHVNGELVHSGPVKGDSRLWFYDEIDLQPLLRPGLNCLAIRVLRFFHATSYATSFPRLSIPGLFVRIPDETLRSQFAIQSDSSWETALDASTTLPVNQKEDDFLHVYEKVEAAVALAQPLVWVKSKRLDLPTSHGLAPPWILSPRMIPFPNISRTQFKHVHNVRSPVPRSAWESLLLSQQSPTGGGDAACSVSLPCGTSHHVELELDHHTTAALVFRFGRSRHAGSRLVVTYSEAYEDDPTFVPYLRNKGDRLDTTKLIIGPQDSYTLSGVAGAERDAELGYSTRALDEEHFAPFHFRTFRLLALDIEVGMNSSDSGPLELLGIDVDETHCPLDVKGGFTIPKQNLHDMPSQTKPSDYENLWSVSVQTLTNCMHDCYEDCPFYEQLQYAMDLRSSCLFTYAASGDDRMARQAIVQLHNTYIADSGLLASRGPAHQLQVIPHFSLFWICALVDHYEHAGNAAFTSRFTSTCDGILQAFARRVDPATGLVASDAEALGTHWDFVDWTNEWRPMGTPPAAQRTGFLTFTSMLYAYTLRLASTLVARLGRPAVAAEYVARADALVAAVSDHSSVSVSDNSQQLLFTDGLAATADLTSDLSQHTQVWAVLSGVVTGEAAQTLMREALSRPGLTKPSAAMSLYVLRALSEAGGTTYVDHFHDFWDPWRAQIAQNLSTWCEDDVTQRSDCHAWSCAPLYEFMAEVAGIRPAQAGWHAVSWRPRLGLFPRFEGRVPLGGIQMGAVAHVSWGNGLATLEIRDGKELGAIPVHVDLSHGEVEIHMGPVISINVPNTA